MSQSSSIRTNEVFEHQNRLHQNLTTPKGICITI